MTVRAPERPRRQSLERTPEPQPRARTSRPVVAGALAAGAAAWMAAGLFRGASARVIALGGVALGAGLVAVSLRTRRPSVVQYLVLPAALVAGALIVVPETGGGSANIITLIDEALSSGGLAQPPVAFDPGWRFLLFVVSAFVAAAAGSVALSLERPKLAAAVPVPLLMGAALLQPEGGEVATTAVAATLMLGALAVSYGGELGEGDARFESRRLARGGLLVVLLIGGIVALNQASVLFPEAETDRVVPAQRPPAGQGIGADRVLFTVQAPGPGPWRLGVLDVYDGTGWLLPPFDPGLLVPVEGEVPGAPEPPETINATFTVADLPGHTIPAPAEPLAIDIDEKVQVDPRTGVLRLPEVRARAGLTYTVVAPASPTGRALADAPSHPQTLAPFLDAPAPPNEVVALLAEAPENPWDRLVAVRAALFENVIAAGQGHPVDVPPARVAAMLGGAEATPYEITAAEALLARWAGVPSRIGFGFYNGDRVGDTFEVRPRHGAAWLEVYFEGHGWVPVVGVPPRARSSLAPTEQQENPNVLPSEELAVIVHVPIRSSSPLLLFVTVRWWLARALPIALGAALVWWLVPVARKAIRRYRRRRWARTPAQRIALAYADLRDTATDLGVDGASLTPLEFTRALEADAEHDELAWLVTRALWGDLRRDLRDADAERAATMSRSVTKRLRRAHPAGVRLLATGARASLRRSWSDDLPNAWIGRPPRRRLATTAVGLLVALGACAQAAGDPAGVPGDLPSRMVPASLGEAVFQREPLAEEAYVQAGDASLIHEGRVFTLRVDGVVEGYVQVASFVAGIDALDDETRDAVLGSIALGTFRLERLGDERVWMQQLPEQRMFLTFAPDGRSFTLLVARRSFAAADQTFLDLVRFQRGDPTGARAPEPPAYDPRRGTR